MYEDWSKSSWPDVLSRSQRTQLIVLLFNIIALYINTLCPLVLQLVSPFKIEHSYLFLIDRRHDTFIASKTSATKVGFQFPKQVEVRGGKVTAAIATWDVWADAL
jgi:hypothetical protein